MSALRSRGLSVAWPTISGITTGSIPRARARSSSEPSPGFSVPVTRMESKRAGSSPAVRFTTWIAGPPTFIRAMTRRILILGEGFIIEVQSPGDHAHGGELLLDPQPGGLAEAGAESVIRQHRVQRAGESIRVPGRDQHPGDPVLVHEADTRGQVAGHYRLAARHGLELGDPEGLAPIDGRQREHVAGVEQQAALRLGHLPEEGDPIAEPELPRQGFQRCSLRPPPSDEQASRHPRHGADEHVQALVVAKNTQEENDPLTVTPAERLHLVDLAEAQREAVQVDTERDHHAATSIWPQERRRVEVLPRGRDEAPDMRSQEPEHGAIEPEKARSPDHVRVVG